MLHFTTFVWMGSIRQKVSLEGIRFFAYHGFYEEERALGAEFVVNIETELEVFGHGDDQLSKTINYERLFEIASAEMQNTRKLLETVAHAILERIRHEFLAVKNIRICIRKLHPPLQGEVDSSAIELIFSR